MPDRITHLTTVRPIVDAQASATQEMRSWAQSITDLSIVIGTGSPEGVIESVAGALYMNDIGTAGNILYVKRSADVAGDRTKGWVLC